MKASLPICVAIACLSFAADAATVSVNIGGTIVPSSCTPTISNGGLFDLGAIDANLLSSTGTTNLSGVGGNFSVTCTGSTVMAFMVNDNKQATELGTDNSFGYGLGLTTGGTPIGRYRVQVTPASIRADSVPASLIESVTRVSWVVANGDNLLRHSNPDLTYAFTSGPTSPMSLLSASFDFTVLPTINSRSALALTQDESLDGSATFEIMYL